MPSNEISLSNASLIELIKGALDKNSSFRFKVSGFSMSPFIKDGDIVTLSPVKTKRMLLGRAVAFIDPLTRKLVVHRIVGVKHGGFIIKGDVVVEPDGLIPKENILGSVTKIERNGKNARLGLGPECLLIAFLSKSKLLSVINCLRRLIP